MSTTKPLITVSVLLKGENLDPDHVSKELRIPPSMSQRKGEKRGGNRPNSKVFATKIGAWWFWVDNKSRADQDMISEIPQMTDDLLKSFELRQESLDKISGVDAAYLDILVLQKKKDKLGETAEFVLGKSQIMRLNQLGLAMSVTISSAGE